MKILPFKAVINENINEPYERYYLYQIEEKSHISTGLIASISIENIKKGQIVCHEQIFTEKISPLYEEFRNNGKQKNPILLITDEEVLEDKIKELLACSEKVEEKKVPSGAIHRLWRSPLNNLSFQCANSLCVADGHHRLSALMKYYQDYPTKHKEHSAIMATIFYTKQVKTRSKCIILNHLPIDPSIFMHRLNQLFDIQSTSVIKEPIQAHEFHMLYQKEWKKLSLKYSLFRQEYQNALSIELFKEFIVNKILNFTSYTNNSSIKMLFEKCNFSFLNQHIQYAHQVGFVISSDPQEKILDLARRGKILEPNSTYFEPKFLNSLIERPLTMSDD